MLSSADPQESGYQEGREHMESESWDLGVVHSPELVIQAWRDNLSKGLSPPREAVEDALLIVGRCAGPAMLEYLLVMNRLTPQTAQLAGDVWSMAEYPDEGMARTSWRRIFKMAGFCKDGVPADRPTQSLVLFRGATEDRAKCWSWTDDRAVAEKYASGHFRREPGRVWRALVEPRRLLAHNTGRNEAEWVVDTRGLKVEPA
jgi:hypothetical protein